MDILSDVNVVGSLTANVVETNYIVSSFGKVGISFGNGGPLGTQTLTNHGVICIGDGTVGYHTVSVMKTRKITVPSGCTRFLIENFCSYSCYENSNYNNFPIVQIVNLSTGKKVETDLEFILSTETGTPMLDVISQITPMDTSTDFAVSITRLP